MIILLRLDYAVMRKIINIHLARFYKTGVDGFGFLIHWME
jgi:hypothetical protein